ncbi:MAG: tRNA lysidine(34) synthetase TilS [Gammaproteobacteria bacterium]|nr:tRNA lysidine(34) synthetase TilS [Gammaproteobacteria bacterium]
MTLSKRFAEVLESLFFSQSSSFPIKRYLVAYSGGLDSHALLHLCVQYTSLPVRAVHIHHGLQNEADQWSEHCAEVCDALQVPYKTIHVDASKRAGESPEETARKARYAALNSELESGDCLLTAHHQDDQSETVLLQLFRGAGSAGLAAMPVIRKSHQTFHARPLLSFTRDEIHAYAIENDLKWVDDPSNADTDFDRNLLRQDIIPDIKKRWPQLGDSLSRVASQQQDVLEIIEAMAGVDLASIVTQQAHVNIAGLTRLSKARQLNVLRTWIHQCAHDAPTANVLQQVLQSVLPAADDACPEVCWGESEIRRYQGKLYCLKRVEHDTSEEFDWNPGEKLVLKGLGIELSVELGISQGLKPELLDKKLKIKFRQGGEKIQPAGRKNTHSLKKLMQEAGIPPWERTRIPLIYLNDQLIAVGSYWLLDEYISDQGWLPAVT